MYVMHSIKLKRWGCEGVIQVLCQIVFTKISIMELALCIGFLESERVWCPPLRIRAFYSSTYKYMIDPDLLPYHINNDRKIVGIEPELRVNPNQQT
jgi:hypothetical protein